MPLPEARKVRDRLALIFRHAVGDRRVFRIQAGGGHGEGAVTEAGSPSGIERVGRQFAGNVNVPVCRLRIETEFQHRRVVLESLQRDGRGAGSCQDRSGRGIAVEVFKGKRGLHGAFKCLEYESVDYCSTIFFAFLGFGLDSEGSIRKQEQIVPGEMFVVEKRKVFCDIEFEFGWLRRPRAIIP